MLTFQQIILKLQQYWDAQGCALLQPYDMEVGAGTSHTATFLRAIGPEPWKAAYVQPSRRPKDGRYGENPNRLQHYYQYQVVLKPAPSNILELYLGSLEALGFGGRKIATAVNGRFVAAAARPGPPLALRSDCDAGSVWLRRASHKGGTEVERRRGAPTSSPPRPIHQLPDAPDGSTSLHYSCEYVICRIDKLTILYFDYLNFTMPTAPGCALDAINASYSSLHRQPTHCWLTSFFL